MNTENFTNGDTPDDLALVQRLATGDEQALIALYNRYADSLYAFIFHHLGERCKSEDLWQDTWMAALHAIRGYRAQSSLFTWLCAIARHKIADYRRRCNRQNHSMVARQSEDSPVVGGPIPEEILCTRGVRLRVVETLAALPENYRRALIARYTEECSIEEIARRLDKSYKATESLLSRAKNAFRSIFGQKGEIK